jgi:tRNA-dihydrouridine synthase C
MVADPGLALAITQYDALTQGGSMQSAVAWTQILGLMRLFWQGIALRVAPRHRAGRLKQWLNYLRRVYPEAQEAFDQLRLLHDPEKIDQWLAAQAAG